MTSIKRKTINKHNSHHYIAYFWHTCTHINTPGDTTPHFSWWVLKKLIGEHQSDRITDTLLRGLVLALRCMYWEESRVDDSNGSRVLPTWSVIADQHLEVYLPHTHTHTSARTQTRTHTSKHTESVPSTPCLVRPCSLVNCHAFSLCDRRRNFISTKGKCLSLMWTIYPMDRGFSFLPKS